MKKKILSLILSMVLIVGAMPAMNLLTVSAAGGTVVFEDNFENYYVGDKAVGSDGEKLKDKSQTVKWTPTDYTVAEIVSGIGYGGTQTQYLDVTVTERFTTSGSKARLYSGTGALNLTGLTGKYIYEFKLGFPTTNPATYFTIGAFRLDTANSRNSYKWNGTDLGLRTAFGDWASIKIVTDASTDKSIVYINDEIVSYNEITYSGDGFPNAYPNLKYMDAGTHFYIDDYKMWHTPSATTVSSTFPAVDATDVARTVNPTFTFNEKLLDWEYNSAATAVITNTTNDDTVEATLSQSADGKTLTVTPAANLDYGKTYSVALSGVKDMYDAPVTVAPLSFTVISEPKYEVTAPVFKKHNLFEGTSSAITQLENGSISCTYSITNNESEAKPVCFLVVLYENNELKQFLFKEEMLAQGATSTFSGGFTVGDAANSRIQTFIWNSLTSMGALGSSYTLDSTGVR